LDSDCTPTPNNLNPPVFAKILNSNQGRRQKNFQKEGEGGNEKKNKDRKMHHYLLYFVWTRCCTMLCVCHTTLIQKLFYLQTLPVFRLTGTTTNG